MKLEEDHYVDNDNVLGGCFEEFLMLGNIENNPDDYPNGINDFTKVYDKGHPILWEKF